MNSSRRALLLSLASLASASLLAQAGCSSPDAATSSPETTPFPTATGRGPVIVLGGGPAGLCAAYELMRAGVDVTLLEAQERVGGRVLTHRGFAEGMHAELGAARISQGHRYTLAYCRHFGLELTPFYPEAGDDLHVVGARAVRAAHGQDRPIAEYGLPLTEREAALGRTKIGRKSFVPVLWTPRSRAVERESWPPPRLRKYDAITFREFLRDRGWSDAVFEALTLSWSDPNGDGGSALAMMMRVLTERGGDERVTIAGGMDRLPRAFADALADRVRLAHIVEAIDERGDRVVVTARTPSGVQELEAARLICALPLPTLRRVTFRAPLRPEKAAAIEQLTYQSASRVVLPTQGRPWTAQGLSGYALTDAPGEVWAPSHRFRGTRGLLSWYPRQSASRRLTATPPAQRGEEAARQIRRAHPDVSLDTASAVAKCWDEDPWAGGQQLWLRPGDLTTHWPRLATAEGRVHFAGAHTAKVLWVHGALESARRAVAEVLAAG